MAKNPNSCAQIKQLVLDVLKPRGPSLPEFASKLGSLECVKEVDVTLREIDKETETLKVIINGNLDFDDIASAIRDLGGAIHSVDKVIAGHRAIDES
ncbi:hypothetical protein AKJ43_01660 [candidate division MSBL1 archaeon SCGC-AAA261D19]|uniref:DUF211 domain-containing protein n=1 Tax=candidate division MSBL1 archaeon SCGC-AAA261D19 TaxID=1698273 RepID=A0A133V7U8_9EURY|nr:hypothetical protein AKJ43_01660 [candidate division MSBL1 archaeon SCGC-AAA261D19]